ncbi:putative raffinose synthase protein Sip1 [Aspergillus chevalieri]|uniref:Alpha-galactosidase n=1 Tax=Aspergillus chevalieri TaxID=182096 RepID=A0A7R7VG33_ASPCH|nr:uncharacterized protein ACHE_11398S [Aspergillus chevalieri]BCR83996.1 hypothetical protein ACHE_11398S [Aspergillus chevalieri]
MQVNTTEPFSLPILGPQPHQKQQKKPASQLRFIRPAQMSLFARVSCYPPLGQVTCPQRIQKALELEKDDTLRFTVVIESSVSFPEQPWESEIYHTISTTPATSTTTTYSSNTPSSAPEWKSLPLRKVSTSRAPMLNAQKGEYDYYRTVFTEEITLPNQGGYAQFTVKYRSSPNSPWQWVNQQKPEEVRNGELVFAPRDQSALAIANTAAATAAASGAGGAGGGGMSGTQSTPSWYSAPTPSYSSSSASSGGRSELGKYFENLSSEVEVESRVSEAVNSVLWQVSGSVPPAGETESTVKEVVLGVPSSVVRNFSLVRIWTPWLGPRHGRKTFQLTEDAVLCSFLRTDGTHLVLLGVSGVDHMLTLFRSGEKGEVIVKAQSDNTETTKFKVLAAVAYDFEVAMSAVMYEARKLVRVASQGSQEEEKKDEKSEEKPAEEEERPSSSASPTGDDLVMVEKDPKVQWLTEWYDGLTYCTWNGLGQNLTEEKILHALDALKSHGIKIVNLIIDDNWQTLDNEGDSQFKRRWTQFEGNPRAFPEGLRQTVQAIRQRQPSIEHIAVWHALFGYWGGISPNGDLAQRFKTKEVKIKDPAAGAPLPHAFDNGVLLAIEPEDIQTFYDEFYSYLTSVGIDSVKTDAQFFLDLLATPEDRRRFIPSYQDAWSIASLKHFSTRSISCMSTFPQAIFHSQLPTNKPSIPLRNSDDFFPAIKTSHPWHVFCNAHNTLLTRFLNVLPDWDMFQTSHPYASFHAAARCVSGGPIYITDEPGKHDLAVLNQMTAPTTHGTTVILRPSIVGRAMDIYHDYNEGHVLPVGTYTGPARTGSGILGLFNIQDSESCKLVCLRDFPGIHEGSNGHYVVRAHTSGRVSDPMHPADEDSLVMVELGQKGWEILTSYPTHSFTLRGSRGCGSKTSNLTHVAVLGLLGKMTGAAAIVSYDVFIVENGRLRFDIALKALGTLGIYFSDLEDHSIARNFMVMISGRAVPRRTVWKEGGEGSRVLAVDVLGAWRGMGLDSGWGNEAVVQVFVG